MNKTITKLIVAVLAVVGMNVALLAADVAQIGETKYASINDALCDAAYVLEGDVEIKLLADVEEDLADDYLFYKNVKLTTEVEGGVTVDFGYEYGRTVWALVEYGSGKLTVGEGVTVTGLGQLLSGFGTENDVVDVEGDVTVRQLWAYGGTVNVKPTATVTAGYGDGMVKLRYGSAINVTGEGQNAVQFAAGYVSGDYYGDKTLSLTDTRMTAEWLANDGTDGFTVNLDNARLELNGALDLGWNATGVINMTLDSSIAASEILNVDEINVDATGVVEPVKLIDCTGAGAMTLADYGTVNVKGGVAFVRKNDLWVRNEADVEAELAEEEDENAYAYTEEDLEEIRWIADYIAEQGVDAAGFASDDLDPVRFIEWVDNSGAETMEDLLNATNLFAAYAFNLPFNAFADGDFSMTTEILSGVPEDGWTTIVLHVKAGATELDIGAINANVIVKYGQSLDAMEEYLLSEKNVEVVEDGEGHARATLVLGPPEGSSHFFKVSLR